MNGINSKNITNVINSYKDKTFGSKNETKILSIITSIIENKIIYR